MSKIKISVIIPTWNAEKILKKNLPKILAALPNNTELIVVENGSTDNSPQLLKEIAKKDKRLKPIFETENLGFIGGCKSGADCAQGEFLAFINNDVIPEPGFLPPAMVHFKDKDVFAVSFNEPQFGWAKIWWRGGFVHHGVGGSGKKAHVSAWASGGSSIVRKSMWETLGGFDPLFAPFYWEDFDLSYRAWKRGWKIIWEPESVVHHEHEATISRLNRSYVDLVKERNQLLFAWKNITDPLMIISQPFGVLLRISTGPNYLKVFVAAIIQWLKLGKKEKAQTRTDREIFNLFKRL